MKDKIEKFVTRPIFKTALWLISAIFLAGVWVDKWEYKMEQMPKEIASELIKQLGELKEKQSSHELSDKYEKQIINNRIDNLLVMINDVKEDINTSRQKAEFIRPTTPELPEPESRIFKKKVR
jgi:hypothetical protein